VAYADLSAQLAGTIPGLSPILAATYVKQAWRDIRNVRAWSFKTGVATLVCPRQVTTGTVAFTQYTSSVTFSAAATTALTPFIAGTPLLTSLQIRFSLGPLYRILAITQNSPLIVTLDRPIQEATATLGTYTVYRAYVAPPVTDFQRWESFADTANQLDLKGPRLTRTSLEFDSRDPGRVNFGWASYLGSFVADAAGTILYELWPHPVDGQTFQVTFKRLGVEFSAPGDTQPLLIPDALISTRALGWYGYPWAQANKARIPDLRNTDFLTLIGLTRKQYQDDLVPVKMQDDELMLQSVYNRGHFVRGLRRSMDPPLGDAAYWQSHPIYW